MLRWTQTRHWTNVVLMLHHGLWCWPNIKPTLPQHHVLVGKEHQFDNLFEMNLYSIMINSDKLGTHRNRGNGEKCLRKFPAGIHIGIFHLDNYRKTWNFIFWSRYEKCHDWLKMLFKNANLKEIINRIDFFFFVNFVFVIVNYVQ